MAMATPPTVEHGYHYDKTFCDGHPAPAFVPVPEEEEDEEGEVINEEEIEAAQAENIRLANSWLLCEEECEKKAGGDFEGVHFHWIMEEVDDRRYRVRRRLRGRNTRCGTDDRGRRGNFVCKVWLQGGLWADV